MDSLIVRFTNAVECFPSSRAITWKDNSWNYKELSMRVGTVQAFLLEKSIGSGHRVGISLSRGPHMIAAILGVIATGATYVPLDPNYPVERLKFMVDDAECSLVFCDGTNQQYLGENQAQLPEGRAELLIKPPSDIANIIYTSGSTGTPKGVMVKSSSVLQLIDWAHQTWSTTDFSCVCSGTSISFDVSVFELFAPLTCGGEVLLLENILEFIDHPERERVTLISTVPSAMTQILRVTSLPDSVRNVCIAGEAFPLELAKLLVSPKRRVFNLYGPTEDTVFSTMHELKGASSIIPIGHPIDGTRAYVLDPDGNPIPDGDEGELYLAGKGVAAGYLNRPELTEERFLIDLENSKCRMYRTGDIVKRDENGQLIYCGRQDQQIKLRGFRIELGEIQAAIQEIPEVVEAVVLNVPNAIGEPRIMAWASPENLSQESIRDHLSNQLPNYMIPIVITPITVIPRLPNGKLDRNALPSPRQKRTVITNGVTQNEQVIKYFFESVLGIDEIGLYEHFTELGGNSLGAMSVISRIKNEFNIRVSLDQFFAHDTVAEQARLVEESFGLTSDLPPLTRAQERNLPTPAQEQMWVMEQIKPKRLDYLTASLIELETNAPLAVISDSVMMLIHRHISLHSTIHSNQRIEPILDKSPLVQLLDDHDNPKKVIERTLRKSAEEAIDISTEFPLRVFICGNSQQIRVVGMIVHHIAIDGWSIDLFVDELTQIISAQLGTAPILEPLKIDTRDYAAWLRDPKVIAYHTEQCQKRVEVLKNAPQKLNWPGQTRGENGLCQIDLPKHLLDTIAKCAKLLKTTSFVVQLSAFAEVLCQYLSRSELIIGTAAVNRRHPELEKVVACLTNLVPIKLLRGDNLIESCTQNHSEVYQALECSEVPFSKIIDALDVERSADQNPLVQVAFGIEAPTLPSIHGSVRGKGEEIYLGHTRLDLTVWVRQSGENASAIWTWKGNCIDECTIRNLHKTWINLLEVGVRFPQSNWIMKRQFNRSSIGGKPRRPISEKLFSDHPGKDGVSWVYQANSAGGSLTSFIKNNRSILLDRYHETGAILLRGFQLGDSGELAEVVDILFSSQVKYGERSSPRSKVTDGVYTSTDHPSDQPIVLHNEQSYTLNWPIRILFRCDIPSKEGGATPIADMRKVLAQLKPETVQKFAERGVLYQRNYLQGIGVSWQVAFQTEDPKEVETYCHNNHIDFEWINQAHLRTTQIRPALRLHPESKELLFFNHALFFHVTSLPPELTAGLKNALQPSHYPTQTYWGNGFDFEDEVLDELRAALEQNTVRFEWQTGDVLILDNMKIAHGRDPFVGERKVIVAMADPIELISGKQSSNPADIEIAIPLKKTS